MRRLITVLIFITFILFFAPISNAQTFSQCQACSTLKADDPCTYVATTQIDGFCVSGGSCGLYCRNPLNAQPQPTGIPIPTFTAPTVPPVINPDPTNTQCITTKDALHPYPCALSTSITYFCKDVGGCSFPGNPFVPNGVTGQNQCDEVGEWCCIPTTGSSTCHNGLKCGGDGKCYSPLTPSPEAPTFNLCQPLSGTEKAKCETCQTNSGIYTALGCISFNTTEFTKQLLSIAIGLAGGLALLLMLYGSFVTATSTGEPKKMEEGRGIITSAIVGLLVIIFSVFLLRFIGITVFNLPGF